MFAVSREHALSNIGMVCRMTRALGLAAVAVALSCGGSTGSGPPADGGPSDAPPIDATVPDATVPDASLDASPAMGCFAGVFANPDGLPDYSSYAPTVGSHCVGTDHQAIAGIERVVFLGDSISVGAPPVMTNDFYRSKLADLLVAKFSLVAPNAIWKNANPITGTATIQDSGDFSSCAQWGARADDLAAQITDCFPQPTLDKKTLVFITAGMNDFSAIAKDGIDGATSIADLQIDAQQAVGLMRNAVEWFYEDPSKFPNGVFVVFANTYEYTDGTGSLGSCPGAGLAGFDGEWPMPSALMGILASMNEQYMSIAHDTQTDMIFLQELFCGRGFNHDNPEAPCYRGTGNENWFDLTCLHPTAAGHAQLADMFMAIVDE